MSSWQICTGRPGSGKTEDLKASHMNRLTWYSLPGLSSPKLPGDSCMVTALPHPRQVSQCDRGGNRGLGVYTGWKACVLFGALNPLPQSLEYEDDMSHHAFPLFQDAGEA